MFNVEQNMSKISTFFDAWHRFRLFSSLVVVIQELVFQCPTRVIEQDTCKEKEKVLRVHRAVNIG